MKTKIFPPKNVFFPKKFKTLVRACLSATLSHLYCVLGDFHISTDNLVQNVSLVFWFLHLFYWQ